ncbi:MAG: Asd/ArgC dimerization domain-containing protein [Myxococcota bacterium]
MSRTALDVAVLGATGAAAEALLDALGDSDVPIGQLRAYGSAARSPRVDTVQYGGNSVGVEPIARVGDVRHDVAFLCLPPRVAATVGPALVQKGVFVVDVGDATAGVLDAPLVLPGAQAALPAGVAEAGAVRTPSAAGWLLARLLAPLSGVTGVSGVVNRSAASRGKPGMDELGQQVVATLNQTDPPRRVFADGLAFDTLPEDVEEDAWSAAEETAAAEVAALTPAKGVAVQICTQPLFSGISAGLHLRGVDVDACEAAWAGADGLVAVRRAAKLRPRQATGRTGVLWGRLRADPAGDGVHVWAVGDPLAGAAADVPARVLAWLYGAGLLGDGA